MRSGAEVLRGVLVGVGSVAKCRGGLGWTPNAGMRSAACSASDHVGILDGAFGRCLTVAPDMYSGAFTRILSMLSCAAGEMSRWSTGRSCSSGIERAPETVFLRTNTDTKVADCRAGLG